MLWPFSISLASLDPSTPSSEQLRPRLEDRMISCHFLLRLAGPIVRLRPLSMINPQKLSFAATEPQDGGWSWEAGCQIFNLLLSICSYLCGYK